MIQILLGYKCTFTDEEVTFSYLFPCSYNTSRSNKDNTVLII